MRKATRSDIRRGAVIKTGPGDGYTYRITVVSETGALRMADGCEYFLGFDTVDRGDCELVTPAPDAPEADPWADDDEPTETPGCTSCGLPWVQHNGVILTCKALMAAREEIVRLSDRIETLKDQLEGTGNG